MGTLGEWQGDTAMRAIVYLGVALTLFATGSGIAEAKTKHATTHRHRTTHHPVRRHAAAAAVSCGGTERWDVKDGSDQGAPHVHPVVVNGITIVDLNQLLPQPLDADGRMQEEKVIYRLTGILRRFKHDADGDYHVVIADDATTPYALLQSPASGHSMVVEVPDPKCVSGASGKFGSSYFSAQLQESRSDFEAAIKHLPMNKELGSRNIPITVTGVLFFDFLHGQTGHGLPHPNDGPERQKKVVELHPVLCNDVNGYREQAGKAAC